MRDTAISWTDDTVNAWWGCTKVSPACTHCYAESLSKRFGRAGWGDTAPRMLRVEKAIAELRAIAARGDREGRPRRVFMQSMWRIGKHAAGRLLDGRTWDDVPGVSP